MCPRTLSKTALRNYLVNGAATMMRLLPRSIALLGISAALGGGAAGLLAQAPSAKAPSPTLVEVTEIEQRTIQPRQTFVGTVMPSQKAVVGSAVDGRVIEFPI